MAGHENRKETIHTGAVLESGYCAFEKGVSGHKRSGAGGQAQTFADIGAETAPRDAHRQKKRIRLDSRPAGVSAKKLQGNRNLGNRQQTEQNAVSCETQSRRTEAQKVEGFQQHLPG